jgi:hypothetical protein
MTAMHQPFEVVEEHYAGGVSPAGWSWRRAASWAVGLLALHGLACAAYIGTVGARHRVILDDQAFLADARPLRLLVVGDSHPRNAVDDALLPGALNLANGGESYVKTFYRLSWLLEQGDRPVGAVLLTLEPQAFDSWHADYYQPEYVYGRYVPFLEVGLRRGRPVQYLEWWIKAHVAPYAGEARTLSEMVRGQRDFRDDLGAMKFSSAGPTEQWALARARADWHFQGHDYRDPLQQWAFEQTLARCASEGIRVILVSYPVSQEYWHFVEAMGPAQAMREIAGPILAAHPELVHLDYHDAFFGRNDLFHDPDHVNRAGRQRFTRLLNDDLIRLGVTPEDSAIPPRRAAPAAGRRAVEPPPG